MSTPQGPDRYGADRDPDQAGPPTWGTPPPGGWGGHPDPGPPTGAWDPATDEYGDQGYPDRGYDAQGYDAQGYDAQGYDAQGYDAQGYDAQGYDAQGYGGRGYDDRAYTDPAYGDPAYGGAAYGGRRRAEDREAGWGAAPADAPWGDRDPGGVGHADDPAFGAGRPGGRDPWSDTGETTAVAWGADPQAGGYLPGDEPWAPREQVRGPRRGPFGLGTGALAGIGLAVVAVIVLAVLFFVTPGWAVTRTLDKTALQNGVTQILTQNYGLQVGAVECPDDVAVEADTEFACQALVDGEPVTVPGKVTSDEGDYQVSRV
jgi:hypothetical protein